MNHIYKYSPTYECLLYIGSRERYNGRSFDKREVIELIKEFQKNSDLKLPVRISDTTYFKEDYEENGFEISIICYPNKPKTVLEVKKFANLLSEHLLYKLNQNRITLRCIGDVSETIMIESIDAEEHHNATSNSSN